MFQQYFVSSQSYGIITGLIVVSIVLMIAFSRVPLILKVAGVLCIAYAAICIHYPETLTEYLGQSEQSVAYAVLSCSLIALVVSFARFLKAGLIIGLWLFVSIIVAERAFPGVVEFNLYQLKAVDSIALHRYVTDLVK